jgi:polygalacturonase
MRRFLALILLVATALAAPPEHNADPRPLPAGANSANYQMAADHNWHLDHTVGWINVKQAPYSATGNGRTDDSAAIQAAIDALPSTGGVVYFPTPSVAYKLGTGLSITNKTNVRLEAFHATIKPAKNTRFLTIAGSSNVKVTGFRIEGTRVRISGNTITNCNMPVAVGALGANVEVSNNNISGAVYLASTTPSSGYGILINTQGAASEVVVSGNMVSAADRNGIDLTNARQAQVIGNFIKASGRRGTRPKRHCLIWSLIAPRRASLCRWQHGCLMRHTCVPGPTCPC